MKLLLKFISIAYILFLSSPCFAEKLDLSVTADAAILMNADTGAILYAKNIHKPHYPASITKIVTAILALQKASDKLEERISADQDCIGTVTEEAIRRSNYTLPSYLLIPDGSHIGIKKGEILSLKDLLYGMMLASGDDAANIIAKYVGGTIPLFMEEMNDFVTKTGCQGTKFYNPHGLHHPKQVTTAFDMALIAREGLKIPQFREIVSTVRYARPKTNKQESTMLVQTNRLMRQGSYFYPKAIGIKTGYYSLAGSTLVAAAKDGDRTLIAVLLKVQERKDIFMDAKKMFETAFSQPKVQRVLLKKGPQKFTREFAGGKAPLNTYISEDVTIEYYPAEESKVKCLLYWNKDITLPIAANQPVGDLIVQNEAGQTIRTTKLYSQQAVEATFLTKVKDVFGSTNKNATLFKVLGVGLVVAFMLLLALQLRKK